MEVNSARQYMAQGTIKGIYTNIGVLTAATGHTFISEAKKAAYKNENVVSVITDISNFTPSSTGWEKIATLPNGYVPELEWNFQAVNNVDDSSIHCRIYPKGSSSPGSINIYCTANVPVTPVICTSFVIRS